jgi:hypothetical protein
MSLIPLHIIKRMGKVWLYLLLLYVPGSALAQDEEVVDTTIVYVDSAVAPVAAPEDDGEVTGDTDEEVRTPDTPSLRVVPDSVVKQLKDDEQFAYANDPAYWDKAKQPKEEDTSRHTFWDAFAEFFAGGGARTVVYIILGVGLVLLIYRLIVVNNLLVRSTRRNEALAEEEGVEIDDANLDHKIQAAIQEKNYRPAIRLMYIKALRGLNEKGWIRYHAQGTNYEYLSQVQPYGVGNEFRFITYVYEYVWYGEFILSDDQFGKVQQNFQHFFNTIRA